MSSQIINYFIINIIQMLFTLLFRNWIGKQTAFKNVIGGVILKKWVSSASYALEALLLVPKTVQAWKIAGNNSKGFSPVTFPTSPLLFGMGNPFGLQSGYHRSSNKNKRFYRLWPGPPCIFLCFLVLIMTCKCLSKMQLD